MFVTGKLYNGTTDAAPAFAMYKYPVDKSCIMCSVGPYICVYGHEELSNDDKVFGVVAVLMNQASQMIAIMDSDVKLFKEYKEKEERWNDYE